MPPELIVALVSSVFTAIVGPIAVHYFKEKLEKNKKKDILKESLATNALVSNKLEGFKEHFKADRVWLAQFHNGGNFYPSGKSIQKFSMFYETVNQNVDSTQQNFQNIPVSLFSRSINQILEHNIIAISDFKNESIDTYGLKYVAEESRCKSGYLFAIKTIDNKFVGMLGLDYVKKKVDLTEEELNSILVEASSIGGVLNKN